MPGVGVDFLGDVGGVEFWIGGNGTEGDDFIGGWLGGSV